MRKFYGIALPLAQLALCLCFLSTTCALADKGQPVGQELRVNAAAEAGFRYDELQEGAGIYLCTVDSYISTSAIGDPIDSGPLTLRITETIRPGFGIVARDGKLTLPYSYLFNNAKAGPGIWPKLTDIEKKPILCVIIPGAYDPCAARLDNVNIAASEVYIVTGKDDPMTLELREIARLHKITDLVQLKAELATAIADKIPGVRKYAIDAIAKKLANPDPNYWVKNSLALLMDAIIAAKGEVGETRAIVNSIHDMCYHAETKDRNALILHALADLIINGNSAARNAAIVHFEQAVTYTNKYNGMHFAPADLLTNDEQGKMTTVLDEVIANRDNDVVVGYSPQKIKDWLEGK